MTEQSEQGQLGTCKFAHAFQPKSWVHAKIQTCKRWQPVPAPAPSPGGCACPHGCGLKCDEQGRCPVCWNGGKGCPIMFGMPTPATAPPSETCRSCGSRKRTQFFPNACPDAWHRDIGQPVAPDTPAVVQSSVAKFGQGTSKRNCGNLSAETVNVEDMPHQTPALPDQNFRPADSPVGAPPAGTQPSRETKIIVTGEHVLAAQRAINYLNKEWAGSAGNVEMEDSVANVIAVALSSPTPDHKKDAQTRAFIRKELMERFSDKLTPEEIATFSYDLAGKLPRA